jgi:hypothetical protein
MLQMESLVLSLVLQDKYGVDAGSIVLIFSRRVLGNDEMFRPLNVFAETREWKWDGIDWEG